MRDVLDLLQPHPPLDPPLNRPSLVPAKVVLGPRPHDSQNRRKAFERLELRLCIGGGRHGDAPSAQIRKDYLGHLLRRCDDVYEARRDDARRHARLRRCLGRLCNDEASFRLDGARAHSTFRPCAR